MRSERTKLLLNGYITTNAAALASLLSLMISACGGRCSESEPKAAVERTESVEEQHPWPKPKVVWRAPHQGQLWPMAIADDRAVVASFSRPRRTTVPDHVVALDLAGGKVAWKTKSLLSPKLVRDGCVWSFSSAVARTKSQGVFAYLRSEDRVTALDSEDGKRLWTVHSRHGVATARDRMVVSNGLTLRVLHPAKGSSVRTTDLSRPTAGGSKDGLRAGLKRSTMLQSLGDGRVLVTRRDGGEIQCLDPFEGEVVWKYAPDGALSRRVLELPVAGKRLLVPLGYPDPRRVTVLTEWGAELDGSKPLWTTELDGKTNGRRVWLFGDEIVARLEGPAGRQFLARLDADSGRLLSKAHIPAVKECMPGWSRNLYCRSGGQVLAFDPRTGRRLWHQGVGTGRDRLHRIWAFDKWVAAVTANRIWLIEADTGRAAWRIGKVFKTSQGDKVRALVSDVLGEVGGRVLLVLNGRVVEKDHRRIFLAAVGLGKGKPEYLTRLGPPGPSRRARRVGHGYEQLDVPVKLASRAGDEVVFSAVGLYSRLIDPKTGARIKDSRQPGEKDAPTSLIEATEGVAFLERSDLMTAVDMTTLETLWKLPVPDLEPTHFGPEGVFLTNGKGKVVWMTRAGRKKLSAPAEETVAEQRAVVQHAGSKGLAIRVGDQTHFVEKSTGEVTVKTKRINVFVKKGSRLFGLQRDHRPAEKTGAYVALDVETGKRLWKKEVSRQLSPLPAPVLAERRWPVAWVRGAGDTFVTTDTLGRCVIALQSSDGAVRWTVCFDRLIGPPIAARGYLFVAAEGPARDLRSKKGEPGEAHTGDKDAIHAIRIRDGKSRRVYVPKNEAHIRFGQARPFEDSAGNLFLLAVEAPTRLALKENEIVAISLW